MALRLSCCKPGNPRTYTPFFAYKRFWLVALLPLGVGASLAAEAYPALTEQLYAQGIYPVLAGVFGRLTSLAPFSLAQGLVVFAPMLLIAYLVVQVVRMVRDRENARARAARLIATLAAWAGMVYFLFLSLCGFNYYREPFAGQVGLAVRDSSVEELAALCTELAQRTNAARTLVAEDGDGVMAMSGSFDALVGQVREAYRYSGEHYPVLDGFTARPKPVWFSRGMSMLDIAGIYVPFTFEANINIDMPDAWIPSTALHELAHSKGVMREDEANFIAYLVGMQSDSPDVQYSALLLALVHSTNALYDANQELYWAVGETYSDGLWRDLADISAYWDQFEGPVAEVSTAVNDVYLKSNRQDSGVKSYGQMVDLLLADYRQRHGEQ